MKLWGNEAFIGKSFVLPNTNLKTLFLTWVFTTNRELGSHMVLQRPPDILTSIGYTTSMRILCFTLVGVIIWKSQRKKKKLPKTRTLVHPTRIIIQVNCTKSTDIIFFLVPNQKRSKEAMKKGAKYVRKLYIH